MNDCESNLWRTVATLKENILNGSLGRSPAQMNVVGASYICQTTKFSQVPAIYLNYYIIMRVEGYLGACVHTPDQLDMQIVSELAGVSLGTAISDIRLPVQIAAMDAYLGVERPHKKYCYVREKNITHIRQYAHICLLTSKSYLTTVIVSFGVTKRALPATNQHFILILYYYTYKCKTKQHRNRSGRQSARHPAGQTGALLCAPKHGEECTERKTEKQRGSLSGSLPFV